MSMKPLVVTVDADMVPDRDLLGGKAASLVKLLRCGAAVPPAFVLTTEAYRAWAAQADGGAVRQWVRQGISELQRRTGRQLGAGHGGLIVSVRSGAPISMPGMMDTVLNAGIGTVDADSPAYIRDARRRFLLQYSEIVLGIEEERIKELAAPCTDRYDAEMIGALEHRLAAEAEARGLSWPRGPEEEIAAAAGAVFASWDSSRAKLYRRMRKIDDNLGTAVTVQLMVFGNHDQASGSGVAFTRDPTTGENGLCGEFLQGGQGEEVVAGRETAAGLPEWAVKYPDQHRELQQLGLKLEADTGKVHEIEFTLERGHLYILQCRPALLTKTAAARIAVAMVGEGRLSKSEAVTYAKEHGFDPDTCASGLAIAPGARRLGKGLPVGGGVAAGRLALSDRESVHLAQTGDPVIFATVETSPSLLPVMQRSAGLITMLGGATSHAAVVARELGTPCVVGVGGDVADGLLSLDGASSARAGDWVTINGDTGEIFQGDIATEGGALSPEAAMLTQWIGETAEASSAT